MTIRLRTLMAALLSAAVALAGGASLAEDGVTKDTILIGAHGPITGPAAFIGLGGRDGALAAIKQINANGGVHGRKLKLVFEDDAHSPAKALAAVKKLVERDKVFMILGLGGSNATIGTVDYVRNMEIPMYVAIASAPQVTHPFSRYLFRGATTESARYGEVNAEFLTQFLQVKDIAVISGADEYAKNEADNTQRMLKEWFGVEVGRRVEFKVGDTDFTPQILQLKGVNPEIVLAFGHTPEVSIIVRQMRELGMDQPIFVGAASVDNEFIASAGYAAEGVMGGWLKPLYLDSKHPDMVEFMRLWSDYLGTVPAGRPNLYDLMGFSEMYVVAEGLRRAGPDPTREKFIDALESLKDYRVSEIATPRTFTDWHHIGNLRQQVMVVLAQRWVPLKWSPERESEILAEFKQ